MQITYGRLIKKYNSIQILKLLGALQLHPINHGKNVLFEEMARLALIEQRNNNSPKPNAHWKLLMNAIELYQDRAYLEDEPTTAFTENVVFAEGNYIVYPGIYVSGSRILNELLECIFLMKNELGENFKKQINDAVGILLFMSNSTAKDIEQGRFLYQTSDTSTIRFPEYEKAMEYVVAINFSKDYLIETCKRHRYDEAIINEFLITADNPDLDDDDPDNNVTNRKPLLEDGEEIILFMPTSVVSALTDFIHRKAKDDKCYDELITLLQERQFDKTCSSLMHMGWVPTDIKLPDDTLHLPVRETVFQFDNQKFGYICFIGKQLQNLEKQDLPLNRSNDSFRVRNDDVVKYLHNLSGKQPFQVLSLFVISETGEDFMFAWPKSPEGHFSVVFPYSELDAIAYSENTKGLTLWKFAKIYNKSNQLFRINAMGGTLDAYVAYESNDGSFLNTDRENPIGGSLFIPVGLSNDFLREIQSDRDEHAAIIFHNRQVAYTKVIRYKKYAPIYLQKESIIDELSVFRLLIETYKMPIWIINRYDGEEENKSWAKYLCEGIAFWLHKMKEYLLPVLEKLTFIQFEIEVIVDKNVGTAYEIEEVQEDIKNIHLKVTIDAPRIQILIPFEFIHLVRLADNYADKLLMQTVLSGLVKYVKEAKDEILLSEEFINEIIENVLRPSNAKMFLFSDPSWKIRLDKRGLSSLRYIHEADTSYILDNLVSYLPADYKIPSTIKDRKEKLNLCNTIVSILINIIRKKIEPFDGGKLLEWLIKINEKCIQIREHNEISIPAKIACFSDFESEVAELLKKDEDRVSTGQATRTLIEFIAANIPMGNKWPNFDEIEELLALVDQVISWGSLSDSIWTGLADPEIGLLPSGRIGTEKLMQRDVFIPYAHARASIEVFNFVEDWKDNYDSFSDKPSPVKSEIEDKLDSAFDIEFGISFEKLIQITWVLVGEGFKTGKGCIEISEKLLFTKVHEKTESITNEEISVFLNLLSLLQRVNIGKRQEGFDNFEIYPWRHKRSLSYLRRPLVKIIKEGQIFYYYGYRHLVENPRKLTPSRQMKLTPFGHFKLTP